VELTINVPASLANADALSAAMAAFSCWA